MIVLVDSREQRPFTFSLEIETRTVALPVGDYSIEGFQDCGIVIERKSIDDLAGSLTAGRERFIRELRQLRAFRFAAIVIEGSWTEIGARQYRSAVHPNSIIGSLMSFAVNIGIVPIMAESHATAGQLTERLLMNFARMIEKDYAALHGAGKREMV